MRTFARRLTHNLFHNQHAAAQHAAVHRRPVSTPLFDMFATSASSTPTDHSVATLPLHPITQTSSTTTTTTSAALLLGRTRPFSTESAASTAAASVDGATKEEEFSEAAADGGEEEESYTTDAAALNIVESINRLTDPEIMSQKGRFKLEVKDIIEQFGGDEFNSGATEVQIAIITRKVAYLSMALRDTRKDKHNIRALTQMISKRRKLLKYLIRQSRPRYYATIGALGLRDIYGDKVLKRKGARKKYPPTNMKKM